jgi:alpha-ribazole phosphatase
MLSTFVFLIRHGEVEQAGEGRFFGHTDVALSAAGRAQVEALAGELGDQAIEAVYASDLARARDSAAPLARRRAVSPVVLPALREMAMGRWEGLTFGEIQGREPEAAARWLADPVHVAVPGGESLDELHRRVVPALREVVAAHRGGRIAVVGHGGSNRVILGDALGLPLANVLRLAQDYGAWSLVEYHEHAAVLHTLNRWPPGVGAVAPVETRAR